MEERIDGGSELPTLPDNHLDEMTEQLFLYQALKAAPQPAIQR